MLQFIQIVNRPHTADLIELMDDAVQQYTRNFKADFYYDVTQIVKQSNEDNKADSNGIYHDTLTTPFFWECRTNGTQLHLGKIIHDRHNYTRICDITDIGRNYDFATFSDIRAIIFYTGKDIYLATNHEEISEFQEEARIKTPSHVLINNREVTIYWNLD